MYSEDDLLPISALQHILFCERQCALIHIEQVWEENRLTAEGRMLHERVDAGGVRNGGDVQVLCSLPLRSLRLGLTGIADVVEMHEERDVNGTIRLRPFPVEYKRGRPKRGDWDLVQLCAQAICLEEMIGGTVPEGAIFYGQPRRRKKVEFDKRLRKETEDAAVRLHELVASGRTPPARYEKKCDNCSLLHLCMPKIAAEGKNVERYIERSLLEKD